MDLYRLTRRLQDFPDSSIYSFDEKAEVAVQSFPELAEQVNALSTRLKAAGLMAGHRVGILASNSIDWIIWDLALLELRCTVVAFPEELGRDQNIALLDNYKLALLVLSRRDSGTAFSDCAHVTWLEDRALKSICVRPDAPIPADTLHVHALTFSSGSSGGLRCFKINKPGGEWDAEQFQQLYDLNDQDRLLIFLPLTNYQQRLLCYGSFWYGISIILCTPEKIFDAFARLQPTLCLAPPLLYEGIYDRYIAVLNQLPPIARYTYDALLNLARRLPGPLSTGLRRLLFARIHRSLGGRIRVLWTGMAPIRHKVLEFFEEARMPLYEAYGISEGGVVAANIPGAVRRASVGRPVPGNHVTLAEDGEILLQREHFTTLGYYSINSSRPMPLFQEDGTLATGDIGRFDQDGFLYLIGRKKEIIVTSQGQKVHPERVEALINACDAVSQVAALGNQLPHLVVLISLKKTRTASVEAEIGALVETVNRQLAPSVRIGKTILITEEFTRENGLLTRNLKLDRRAIERRFKTEIYEGFGTTIPGPATNGSDSIGPADQHLIDEVSCSWKEILGVSELPNTANFFEMGGDSLCAMRIVARLQSIAPQLSVRDVLEAGTVIGLAARIKNHSSRPEEGEDTSLDVEEGVI